MEADQSSAEFAKVLSDELAAIRERRRRNGLGNSDPTPESSDESLSTASTGQDGVEREREQQVRGEALDENLVGLAFSGGGIRSATFNLGVIQGLADAGLLTQFDYLSTVSGGGYIGSWLAAWIKREGDTKNVECQLHSCRTMQARAKRGDVPQGEIFDTEPEPVHHLRAFSNYLTPVLGIMSVDGWVLASIYIRNLLLNLLVLVPFLLALVMFERLLILTFIKTTDETVMSWERGVWLGGLGLFLLMLVLIFLWIHRSMMQIRSNLQGEFRPGRYQTERRYLHRCILIPLLTLSVLSTWLAYGHAQFAAPDADVEATYPFVSSVVDRYEWLEEPWFPYLFSGLTMAILVGAFHLLSRFDNVPDKDDSSFLLPFGLRLLRIGLGLLTGFVGGVMLYGIFVFFHFDRYPADSTTVSEYAALFAITFGPPTFLVALNLIAFLQVGLISRLWSESIREWWASLSGSTMIYIAGWLFIVGLTIWGPWMVLQLKQQIEWIDTALLAGWASAVGGGLAAVHNSSAGGAFKRAFLKVLPYVFVIGLLILTSFVTDYFVPPRGWAHTPQEYLHSVKKQDFNLVIQLPLIVIGLLAFTMFASSRIDVNSFGLHALYKNRLVRCYLGASRPKAWTEDGCRRERGAPTNVPQSHPRSPNPITGFDPNDDLPLSGMYLDGRRRGVGKRRRLTARIEGVKQQLAGLNARFFLFRPLHRLQYNFQLSLLERRLARILPEEDYVGPYHLICAALNMVHGEELAWQERKAESFALTPQYCGSTSTGYSPTDEYSGGISLGEAVSISGAAVSPNMGYRSGGPITALLAIFNMRLGAWLGNPSRKKWRSPGPKHLLTYFIHELFGLTNANEDYVYLSDGGHFENLAVYELLRRRCRFIVVCDSGADPTFAFQDLGGLIRKARIDFGIGIDIKVEGIQPKGDAQFSDCHVAVGTIHYENVNYCGPESPGDNSIRGVLVYIKPSLTGKEPEDVLNYRRQSPQFPHESTTDQWFSESQFESYRALGWHIAQTVFAPVASEMSCNNMAMPDAETMFNTLDRHWRSRSPDEGDSV